MDKLLEKCCLCGEKEVLQLSHIIPSFISKWLKKTSATGHFRDIKGKRQQDVLKMKLLCSTCEQRISNYEKYFAETFFYPLIDKPRSPYSINYDENLIKFLVSLSWRGLHHEVSLLTKEKKQIYSNLMDFYEEWKLFLLNKSKSLSTSHYLFYWGDFLNIAKDLYYGFEFYMNRGVDGCYVSNPDKSIEYMYTKLPRFSIISLITPRDFSGFSDIGIQMIGQLRSEVNLEDSYGFVHFINGRVAKIQTISTSDKELNKIKKKIKDNPARFYNSDTLKTSKSQLYRNNNISLIDTYGNFKIILEKGNRADRNMDLTDFIGNMKILHRNTPFLDDAMNLNDIVVDENNDFEVIQKLFYYFEMNLD